MEKDNKTLIPLAIIVAILVIAGAFVFLNKKAGKTMGEELPADLVAEETINYINENFLSPEMPASLISVSDVGGVYKIRLKVEEMEFDSYVTKDGKFLFPEGHDMTEDLDTQALPETEMPSLDKEELNEFVGCLEKANFVIYGANWCGYTKELVAMLGGWEIIDPIYVECTEKQALCDEKEISGYPTILINDKQYQGGRNFQGFSDATSCPMPEGAEFLNESNPTGGCG